jgi:cytochrome c
MTIRATRTAAVVLGLVLLAGCERGSGGDQAGAGGLERLKGLAVPAEHREGEALFDGRCAQCHGTRALGTAQGPPLVHIYYEPNHHGDPAFYRAAQLGVRQHHWTFGDMPPVQGIDSAQVGAVIGYVRWLQREAGIY